jgi:hypothetical protein
MPAAANGSDRCANPFPAGVGQGAKRKLRQRWLRSASATGYGDLTGSAVNIVSVGAINRAATLRKQLVGHDAMGFSMVDRAKLN